MRIYLLSFFFFSSRRRHTRYWRDWSSDVCSSDLPTADEVFTVVRREIPDISLATVYKALETLVSCGLATKLTYGDGSARYDARTDDHVHARCLGCGIVRDVHSGSVSGPLPEIHPGDGFRVAGYRLEVVGYCPLCEHG